MLIKVALKKLKKTLRNEKLIELKLKIIKNIYDFKEKKPVINNSTGHSASLLFSMSLTMNNRI